MPKLISKININYFFGKMDQMWYDDVLTIAKQNRPIKMKISSSFFGKMDQTWCDNALTNNMCKNEYQ